MSVKNRNVVVPLSEIEVASFELEVVICHQLASVGREPAFTRAVRSDRKVELRLSVLLLEEEKYVAMNP